jgi:hypothetical protein
MIHKVSSAGDRPPHNLSSMNINLQPAGDGNATGTGTVTREMVHARAAELAAMDGRGPDGLTMTDLAEAKRELTGETYQASGGSSRISSWT